MGATHVDAEEFTKKLALAPFAREEGEGVEAPTVPQSHTGAAFVGEAVPVAHARSLTLP